MLRINFNDNWYYGDATECRDIFDESPEFQKITLPHDAMIKNKRTSSSINENTTGFFPGNSCIYTKTIIANEEWKGKNIFLEFEGAYMNSMVYVNEMLAGKCPYGYSGFYVEISDFFEFGQKNVIKVLTKNDMELTSRWYPGSGIYRNVNLLIGNELYIKADGVKVNTPDVAKEGALIHIETNLTHRWQGRKKAVLKTEIFDENQNLVDSDSYPFTIWSNEEKKLTQRIWIDNPKLWSIETPVLYSAESRIYLENEVIDVCMEHFGIRDLKTDTRNGLRINGTTVKLRGACLHHDNGVLGAATYAQAEERRVRILKEAGFNAIRSAHNPMSKQMLEACDRLGMLVIDESFDMWNTFKADHDYSFYFAEWWKHDLKAMVDKDYNHPCVFMYTVGNEIQEIGTDKGRATNLELANYVRSLDTTRFVGNAINGMFAVMNRIEEILPEILEEDRGRVLKSGDINDLLTVLDANMDKIASHRLVGESTEEAFAGLDVCGYNYMDSRYEQDGTLYPNRVIVGSETRPDAACHNWKLVTKLPYLIGDFVWTGWDYLGESGIGKNDYEHKKAKGIYGPYPWYIAYCGDIDICGNRRPQSYYREIIWNLRKEPYIAVENPRHYSKIPAKTNWSWSDTIESWTWPGAEGKPIRIEVYSGGQEVELIINGISIEKKVLRESDMSIVSFDSIYQPGKIEAVAYRDGVEIGRMEIVTAEDNIAIYMTTEREELECKTEELVYVQIGIRDRHRRLNTAKNIKIHLTLDGPGEILGYGSADPLSLENFYDRERTTFYGRALAVLKTTNEKGMLRLTASADGLNDTVTEILVK